MNQTEKLAYKWLTEKLGKTIHYRRDKTPKFIDTENSISYEPKRLYGHTIWFYENQFLKLQRENCSVIVINNSEPEPFAVIPIDLLVPDKISFNVLIRVVASTSTIKISEEIKTQLKEIKKEKFKNDVGYNNVLKYLMSLHRSQRSVKP